MDDLDTSMFGIKKVDAFHYYLLYISAIHQKWYFFTFTSLDYCTSIQQFNAYIHILNPKNNPVNKGTSMVEHTASCDKLYAARMGLDRVHLCSPPPLPLLVLGWWCPGWKTCSSTARTFRWFLSAGSTRSYFHRQDSRMCLLVYTWKPHLFLHDCAFFYVNLVHFPWTQEA